MDIWTELSSRFQNHQNNLALVDSDGSGITYRELQRVVLGQAKNILSKVLPKSRIIVACSSPYFEAINILAGFAAGCTVVPLSLKYGKKLCEQIISLTNPDLILTDKKFEEINLFQNHKVLQTNRFKNDDQHDLPIIDTNDLALIMFTSGTTGQPKGVMLSHYNIVSNLQAIDLYFDITKEDHLLICRPLFHVAVMTGEFLIGLYKGVKISFYNEAFSPQRLLKHISKNECSVLCATPTLFYYLSLINGQEKSTITKAVISGERMTEPAAQKILQSFPNTAFYHVYGLTEASPRVCYLEPAQFRNKMCSIGKPLENIEIKIVDENERNAKNFEIGELIVKGPSVMVGYWNNEITTQMKIKDGWLHTGDMCYSDDDGYLYVVGRKDNMMIRAGVNIYPQEIENALSSEPDISEILVYGIDDVKFGQRICAEIVPKSNINLNNQMILEICKKTLPEYQWPSEIRIVSELKKSASGKVIRSC